MMQKFLAGFLPLLALLLTAPIQVLAGDGAVAEFTLDNGMQIVVRPDERAPVVIAQVWYKVGAADEHSGITGVSHVLEHMMFKGTQRYPAGRYSAIISSLGGQENAFTGRDYTAYYQQLEKSHLETSFKLEADRMVNLTLPPKEFAKEVEVVKEERRLRTEDKPQSLTYEQLNAAAYNNAPYHHPVIGWMEDLDAMTVDDLRAWYKDWYAPNNATLVVVGDVDPHKVHRLAKRYFGAIPTRDLPERKPRREVAQLGERRVTVSVPAELPYIIEGYKTPVLGQAEEPWEPYALEVLAGILDGGRSSRLSQDLLRKQELAASADASYDLYGRHASLLLLDATPAEGVEIGEVEQALNNEIDKLKTEPVTKAELERVKAQVVAQKVYQRDSISRQANLIGMLETIGVGWQAIDAYTEEIRQITPAQVQQVAQKYLQADDRTVATLKPRPIDETDSTQPSAAGTPMKESQ